MPLGQTIALFSLLEVFTHTISKNKDAYITPRMFSVSLIQGNKENFHFSVTETGLVRYCWLFFETMKNNIESFFNIVWEMNKKYFGIDLHNNITYIYKTGFRITKIWIPIV